MKHPTSRQGPFLRQRLLIIPAEKGAIDRAHALAREAHRSAGEVLAADSRSRRGFGLRLPDRHAEQLGQDLEVPVLGLGDDAVRSS